MRHPFLHAAQLKFSNRLDFWRQDFGQPKTWLWLLGFIGAIGLAMIAVSQISKLVLLILTTYSTTIGVIAALQASLLVHLGRRKWTAIYSQDWLSSLPVTRRAAVSRIALRSFLATLLLPMLIAAAALTASWGAAQSNGSIAPILVSCVLATVVGALLGWWLPRRVAADAPRVLTPWMSSRTAGTCTLSPLSHWPALQTRAWLPPRSLARLLLPAMLLLPNVSGNVAVAVLCLWVLAWYLCILLRATVRITRDGAEWLRPTPLEFSRFAWAITRYSLFKQLQWTVAAAVLLVALGCGPYFAARLAEGWLAVVSIASALALAHAHNSRPVRLKIAASVGALLALEQVKQHLGVLCALLASAWVLKRAVRT